MYVTMCAKKSGTSIWEWEDIWMELEEGYFEGDRRRKEEKSGFIF